MSGICLAHSLYFGTQKDRVEAAHRVMAIHGGLLTGSPLLRGPLHELERRLDELEITMEEIALGPRCAACGEGPAGGCCSALMAEEVDGVLLVMNALLQKRARGIEETAWPCLDMEPAGGPGEETREELHPGEGQQAGPWKSRIPVPRKDDWECGFLGPRGCILRIKPLFCLSYLCRPIKEELAPEALGRLERATDALHSQQTLVESLILEVIEGRSGSRGRPPGLP